MTQVSAEPDTAVAGVRPVGGVAASPRRAERPALAGASGHNLALDGVRGMAILLVMLFHMTNFHPVSVGEQWVFFATEFGHAGVDLFFVLSGFLITGILYDSRQALQGRAGSYFGNFYARRTLRIFPLYYAVVAFSLILLPHVADLLRHVVSASRAELIGAKMARFEQVGGQGPWFWLYLSNVPIAVKCNWLHGILGVSWSLAIEEQFYLVWPLLVWMLSRRGLMRVCVGLLAVALACRMVLVGIMLAKGVGYGTPEPGVAVPYMPLANPLGVYVLTFCRIDDLAFGALAALALRGSIDLRRAAHLARWGVGVGGVLFVGLALVDNAMGWTNHIFGAAAGPLSHTLGYTAAGVTALGTLVLAVSSRPGGAWHGFWTSRVMRTLGKYAYALYLFHLPIRAVIRDTVFGPRPEVGKGPLIQYPLIGGSELPAQMLFYMIAIGASLAAAWVSWVVFESQILKLKRFFPSGVERAPRAPVEAAAARPQELAEV